MTKNNFNSIQTIAKEYVRENWGSPFIIGFIFLLLTAAVLLSGGSSYWAEEVSIYAYYSIVVGVILQLACFLKYKKKSDDEVI